MEQKYEVTIDEDGTQTWRQNGKVHRIGGPAQITARVAFWCQNGLLHREDGPAAVWTEGHQEWYLQEWYLNGKRHREDGPAIIDINGYRKWYIDGEELTEEEFNNRKAPRAG